MERGHSIILIVLIQIGDLASVITGCLKRNIEIREYFGSVFNQDHAATNDK